MLSQPGNSASASVPCCKLLGVHAHVVALRHAEHACGVALQAKGVADAGSAAFRVSGLELGGLFGSLLAGRISDALIARDPKGGNCGKRVQVCALAHPGH